MALGKPAIAQRSFVDPIVGTVTKALELLDLFTRGRPLIGLSDLARLAGLNKATCYRMMTELTDYGLVEQLHTGREYRLGPAVLRLAALREAQVPTRDAAMPVLQDLARITRETAHLSLLMGGTLRPLAFAYSPAHSTKVTMEDTDVLPFHATSWGLAVLAFQSIPFVNALLAAPLKRLTPHTTTDPAILRERLLQVQQTGFAESHGGYEAEVHSIAVPLFDALGQCTGAVAVAAPASRMTDRQRALMQRSLLRAGTEITTLWGGALPPAVAALWHSVA